jgi:hypothetical protein
MRTVGIVATIVVLCVTACGSKSAPASDYRKSAQLEGAVKTQLESEGKDVSQVVCLGSAGTFSCAYKLTDGLAAVRHVTVAPDGKTWSSG